MNLTDAVNAIVDRAYQPPSTMQETFLHRWRRMYYGRAISFKVIELGG